MPTCQELEDVGVFSAKWQGQVQLKGVSVLALS